MKALLDDFSQFTEGAAHDKKDIPGIDHLFLFFARSPVMLDGLYLRDRIMGDLQIHLGLFHGLQQGPLDPCPGYIVANDISGRSYFVDFIYVDDAVFRQVYIIVRFIHQVTHQIFHIATHIAGFTEFGGIPFDKRNSQLLSNKFDDIGFAYPRRAYHEDIVFYHAHAQRLLFLRILLQVVDPVEMGANLCGQNGLGLVLFYNKAVKIGFQPFR